mgnify:CR=1 FL=1
MNVIDANRHPPINITGTGAISASYDTAQWNAPPLDGANGVGHEELLHRIRSTLPEAIVDRVIKDERFYDKGSLMALLAAFESMAGLGHEMTSLRRMDARDTGFICSSYGGPFHWNLVNNCTVPVERLDRPPFNRLTAVVGYHGGVIGNVTIPLEMNGASQVISDMDSSGISALIYAVESIFDGNGESYVVGGVETCVSDMSREQLEHVLDTNVGRNVRMGDGAAFCHVESDARSKTLGRTSLVRIESMSVGLRTAQVAEHVTRGLASHEDGNRFHITVVDFQALRRGEEPLIRGLRSLSHEKPHDFIHEAGFFFGATASMAMVELVETLLDAGAGYGGGDTCRGVLVTRDLNGFCAILELTREYRT